MTNIWLTCMIAFPRLKFVAKPFLSIFENEKNMRENAGTDTARAIQTIVLYGPTIAVTFGTGEGFFVMKPVLVRNMGN